MKIKLMTSTQSILESKWYAKLSENIQKTIASKPFEKEYLVKGSNIPYKIIGIYVLEAKDLVLYKLAKIRKSGPLSESGINIIKHDTYLDEVHPDNMVEVETTILDE